MVSGARHRDVKKPDQFCLLSLSLPEQQLLPVRSPEPQLFPSRRNTVDFVLRRTSQESRRCGELLQPEARDNDNGKIQALGFVYGHHADGIAALLHDPAFVLVEFLLVRRCKKVRHFGKCPAGLLSANRARELSQIRQGLKSAAARRENLSRARFGQQDLEGFRRRPMVTPTVQLVQDLVGVMQPRLGRRLQPVIQRFSRDARAQEIFIRETEKDRAQGAVERHSVVGILNGPKRSYRR